jgi:hypothetical protein
MKTRASTNTGTARQTVTSRYRMPLPILVRATPEQIKREDYDGLANFDPRKSLRPVKIFGAEYVAEGSKLNKAVRKSMGTTWNLFIAATQLRDAHEKGDNYEIDTAYQALLAGISPESQSGDDRAMIERIAGFWSDPAWSNMTAPVNLPPAVAHELESARLVLWWNGRCKQFMPAVFCDDYKVAMFVQIALRNLRACPCCDKPFIPDRPDQEYCTVRCREVHRQRRRRAKLLRQKQSAPGLRSQRISQGY